MYLQKWQLEMQQQGLDGYKRVADVVSEFSGAIAGVIAGNVSPFVLHCLYEAGCAYAWFYRENGSSRYLTSLENLRSVLHRLETRWAVAGKYF